MKRLLISGLGGSLFPYLNDELKGKFELFYVDSNVNLKFVYPNLNFIPVPKVTDALYFEKINQIIRNNKIDFYIPLIDEEIVGAILKCKDGVRLIAPNIEFARLCLNKFSLMKELEKLNVPYIKSYLSSNYNFELKFPIFLKPSTGRGSRGIFKIDNKNQYNAYFKLHPQYKKEDILVQEYVFGDEYTVGVLTNNSNDIISINSKKVLLKKGITQHAITEHNSIIEDLMKLIVSKLNPCGPFNAQLFITDKGELKIFEINPRFSTTTVLSYAGGVDKISMFIDYFGKKYFGKIVRPKEGIVLSRRWENVFYLNE